jgi:hypothetical protein
LVERELPKLEVAGSRPVVRLTRARVDVCAKCRGIPLKPASRADDKHMEERARLRVAVTAVRSQALDLLTQVSHGPAAGPDESAPELVARLQRVGNDLGWVFDKLPADATLAAEDPSRHAAAALTFGYLTVPSEVPPADQAERWLRILRLHGRTGEALQRAGVRELPLATVAEPARGPRRAGQQEVIRCAAELARLAGAGTTDTVHVLFAVRVVFGSSLDRALYGHGIGWDQLTNQLVSEPALQATR